MQVNMHEAKSQLSQLTEKALQGETVIIAKAGKPLVRLVPHEQALVPRKAGALKGEIKIPDDFDEANEQIEDAFYGEEALLNTQSKTKTSG